MDEYPQIKRLEEGETFVLKMPDCCTAGLDGVPADDCIHVAKEHRKAKRNIGL